MDLPGTTLPRKTDSPSSTSHQLSVAPQLGVGAGEPLPELVQETTAVMSLCSGPVVTKNHHLSKLPFLARE